jgi:hypothetical protein
MDGKDVGREKHQQREKEMNNTRRVSCVVLLLAGSTALATEMRLSDDFKDAILKRDVTSVCRDVVGLYETNVVKPPALGVKPFVIRKAPDGMPRADLRGLPKEYFINITCIDSRDYCRISYQLGHELGHHYINPYRSNWFIESMCGALSLLCLTDMGEKWKVNPPYSNWKSWAFHFAEYRENTVKGMLNQLGLKPGDDTLPWVKTNMPKLISEKKVDRPQQHACALLIEAAFRKYPKAWGSICQLGAATSEKGVTDFAKWQTLVTDDERPLVKELSAIFASLPTP